MRTAVAVTVALALIAACGSPGASVIPAESSPGASGAVHSASPTILPTATAAASPSLAPTDASGLALTLERVLTVDDAELYDIEAFDGGFVAGGCRLRPPGEGEHPCASALLLVSRDGRSWTEVPPPGAPDRLVLGVSDTPLGLLAFATTLESEPPRHRTVWRLVDGSSWIPLEIDAPSSIVFRMALPLAGRTVFFGSDTAYDLAVENEAWATQDGTSWTSGTTPLPWKVPAAPGVVAVGDGCVDLCDDNLPVAISRSADGLTWVDEVLPARMTDGMATVGSVAGRAVIAGASTALEVPRANLWLDDPAGWREVLLDDGDGYQVRAVLDWADGSIVVAEPMVDGPQRAWRSADGQVWEPIRLPGFAGYVGPFAGRDLAVLIVDHNSIWLADL